MLLSNKKALHDCQRYVHYTEINFLNFIKIIVKGNDFSCRYQILATNFVFRYFSNDRFLEKQKIVLLFCQSLHVNAVGFKKTVQFKLSQICRMCFNGASGRNVKI